MEYTTGCLLCGKPLTYKEEKQTLSCAICGGQFKANVTCEDRHYVCDGCHAQKGLLSITATALQTRSKNPVDIAQEMMESEGVHMHGNEHHYLVPAALLAAYRNAGGDIGLDEALAGARQRAAEVPGGVCGFWGSCGAAIGAGIFVSLATGATPLSEDSWRLSNLATSRCLAHIAEKGGPRCCKRDSFLAITTAADFSREHLGVTMDLPETITCSFMGQNRECKGTSCLFHPKYTQKRRINMTKTYILVHGAWQGGWIWERVAPLLREQGHRVFTPDLPGHGEDSRPAEEQDLQSYARDVAALVRAQEGPLILVGHSLGGMTISQAACYAPEQISRLVYICAFLPKDGQSADGLEDGIKPTDWRRMAAEGKGIRLEDGGKTTVMDPSGVGGRLMNCLPADEALEIARRFSPQPLAAPYQAVQLCEAFYTIPKTYIHCLQDNITPLAKQDEMIAGTPVEQVFTLDTDHSPFFSSPRELADILLRAN